MCRSMDGRWSPCSLSAGARGPVYVRRCRSREVHTDSDGRTHSDGGVDSQGGSFRRSAVANRQRRLHQIVITCGVQRMSEASRAEAASDKLPIKCHEL